MSHKELGAELNRDPDSIRAYIKRNKLYDPEQNPDNLKDPNLLKKLKSSTGYSRIKRQLSSDELEYFNDVWVETMKQFELNIKPTEEIQLKQLILVDIYLGRIKIDQKENNDEIRRLDKEIEYILKEPKESRDYKKIDLMQEEINYLRASIKDSTRSYKELLSEFKNIQKELKGARSQRMDKIDEGSKSWSQWLKLLDEEEFRQLAGNDAGAIKMAKNIEKDRLYEFADYEDGNADIPVLNSESVGLIENE